MDSGRDGKPRKEKVMSSGLIMKERLKVTAVIFLTGFAFACSTVFFDTPEPQNSRNLDNVPEKLQGTWKNRKGTCEEKIIINNKSYRRTSVEKYAVSRVRIDTSKGFRISGNKIYLAGGDFSKGYPFIEKNDSLFFNVWSDESFSLSDSVLLRPARDCYVLNIRRKDWWEIVFIQKNRNREIVISYPFNYDVVEMKSLCNVSVLDSTRRDSTYFHAEFTTRNIGKVIPKAGGGVIYVLKPDSTFETPR